MTINELREKRAKTWEQTKAFLDSRRSDKGVLSAEDTATYEKMEQEIVDLGREIERQERLDAFERELNTPVNTPITQKPMNGKSASFIMNDKTIAQIRKLKDNNGAYIWQPSYQAGEPDRILGYTVHTSAYAPENAIAFGDYSYYNIGDRGTRSFKQLNELFAGNGMIGFVAKERVDGKLILPEAVQILKLKTE